MRTNFPESPYFIVETAIERLFDSEIDIEEFLGVVERQQQRVQKWLRNLAALAPSDKENVYQMQILGCGGNSLMAEALAYLQQAGQSLEEESLVEAADLLFEGHCLVEESFQICEEVEKEEDEEMIASLGEYAV